MHIARTTLTAALLSTRLAAQTPPTTTDWLVLDPTTQVLDLAGGNAPLHKSALLDFDDDGRVDLALLGPAGEIGVARDLTGHPRTLPLNASSLATRDFAALQRDGRDALLTAGPTGLHLVDWAPSLAVAHSQLVLAGSIDRVLYARGAGEEGSLAWVLHSDMRALQALLFDSATGALLLVGPELLLPSAIGAAELVDFNGDDHAELAITWYDGLLVIDPFANHLAIVQRSLPNSSIAGDALVRLVDADGNESIAWLERNGTTLSIANVSQQGTARLDVLDDGSQGQSALDVDGNGLADLVLGSANTLGMRVLLSRSVGARFEAGGAFDGVTALPQGLATPWNGSVHLATGDVDRDGDADVVRIAADRVDVARSSQIDANSLAPRLVENSGDWIIDPTGATPTRVSFQLEAPLVAVPETQLVVSLHAGHSQSLEHHSGALPTPMFEVMTPSWPLDFAFELPAVIGGPRVWYVEARFVGGPSGDHEYPSLVVALTPNAGQFLGSLGAPGGAIWKLPFAYAPFGSGGQGTAGSNGEVRIPRLPPPPPPPPTPITPITTPTPGTGGGG